MNLYFLVEGKRTEVKVYPHWLSHLLPAFSRVLSIDAARERNYYLISGEGYPSLLDNHLANAVEDMNRTGSYCYLVLCLDADEWTVAHRTQEVMDFVHDQHIELRGAQLRVVVQNRCIETWFLGNRRALTRAPQGLKLRDYIEFHDVGQLDPEAMGCHTDFVRHADFHHDYLREMLREKNIHYTKQFPRHVTDESYLQQLLLRTRDCPDDLKSFQSFVEFCREVAAHDAGGSSDPVAAKLE